jgi:hypothetical protein
MSQKRSRVKMNVDIAKMRKAGSTEETAGFLPEEGIFL